MTAELAPSLTPADKRRVLEDLAALVAAEQSTKTANPVYSDPVLDRLLPSFCRSDMTPPVLTELFHRLVEDKRTLGSAGVSDRQWELALAASEFHLDVLVGAV